MATLRYGSEVDASFPNNTVQLITPTNMRDMNASNRSGNGQISSNTGITVQMTDGVFVVINPLLLAVTVTPGLWGADGNNRAFPNYAAKIPSLTIPAGYTKFAQFIFNVFLNKVGAGLDTYQFQVERAGFPVGVPIEYEISTAPQLLSFLIQTQEDISVAAAVGLAITPQGTNDNLFIQDFEMVIVDFQMWDAP